MTRFAALVATAATCLLPAACTTPPSGLVIANVSVVSPERASPLERAYVRIQDGKIAELSTRRLRGTTEIDGGGRFLIPGLIDSHVHLAVSPGFPAPMTAEQAATHPEIVAAALTQDPRSYLFFGFTTVYDLIGSAERTARWNALDVRPDAHFCVGVSVETDGLQLVTAPIFSYGQADRIEPAKLTPEAAVARIVAQGGACVKAAHMEGIPGVPAPSLEAVWSLVAAAHARGLPVFLHANRQKSQAFAVAAGVDVIAHGMWRNAGDAAGLDNEAREILAAVARDNIAYQPTSQVIAGLGEMFDASYLTRPELADVYPAALIDFYASDAYARGRGGWFGEMVRGTDFDAEGYKARIRGTLDRATRVTRTLAESRARLVFGSDTPSDTIYTNPPGLNARMEMNNWIAAGVPLDKLFHALTIDNARLLHLDKQMGTVEAGKTANLLLLRDNPLQSVNAYDTIETVFLHGRPIRRAELSARGAANR
jgi:imidazolonepropionase-like amidohydrolase